MSIEVIKKWRRRYEVAQAETRIWKSALEILHGAVHKYLEARFTGGEVEVRLGQLYQAQQSVVPQLGDRRAAIAYQEALILRTIAQYHDLRRSSAVWTPGVEGAVSGLMQALLEAGEKWYIMMKEHENEAEQQLEEPGEVQEEPQEASEVDRGLDDDEGNGLHHA